MPTTTCSLKLAEEMAHEILVSRSSVSLCKTLCTNSKFVLCTNFDSCAETGLVWLLWLASQFELNSEFNFQQTSQFYQKLKQQLSERILVLRISKLVDNIGTKFLFKGDCF